jgi:hypothetical protein
VPKTNRKKKTWRQARALIVARGLTPINWPDSDDYVSNTRASGVWKVTCICGKEWAPSLGSLFGKERLSATCHTMGRHKHTLGDALLKAEALGMEILHPISNLSIFVYDVGERWKFRCRCSTEWFVELNTFLKGEVKSCGHCDIPTYAQVRLDAEARGLRVLKQPGLDSELAIVRKVEDKRWELQCVCGVIFQATTFRLRDHGGIYTCGCRSGFEHGPSQGQQELHDFVKTLGFDDIQISTRRLIPPLEIDIWIPSKKIAIEYNGLYWHGETRNGLEARNDCLRKVPALNKLGIRLVTVFEDEWKYRGDATRAYLQAILGKQKRVGARTLKVIKDHPGAKDFLDRWPLQGYVRGESWSLVDGPAIVAVAVFGRQDASRGAFKGEKLWELLRYCSGDVGVSGGCSRLISAWKLDHPDVHQLVSYSDNRWSKGGLYETVGFEKVSNGRPSYWYYKGGGPRKHRFNYTKRQALKLAGENTDPSQTEWQIMRSMKWDRIWDAGCAKWILKW